MHSNVNYMYILFDKLKGENVPEVDKWLSLNKSKMLQSQK